MKQQDLSTMELRSLLFWTSTFENSSKTSLLGQIWKKKSLKSFDDIYPECPWCHGASVWTVEGKNGPKVINGVEIGAINCYCQSLRLLATNEARWYESPYQERKIEDIAELSIPEGAEIRTRKAKEAIRKFTLSPIRSMLLTGKPGCGKTHMIESVKTSFGGFAVYITLADFFQKLMTYTKADGGDKLETFLAFLRTAPILLLDDFGMQHMTDYGMNSLTSILNYRYSLRPLAPMLVTTNLTLDEMATSATVGNMQRSLSRLIDTEYSDVFILTQADYRNAITKKKMK